MLRTDRLAVQTSRVNASSGVLKFVKFVPAYSADSLDELAAASQQRESTENLAASWRLVHFLSVVHAESIDIASAMTAPRLATPTVALRAWVDRPAETRRGEALHRGRVPRPLNTFMLYRKEHSARAKETMSIVNETRVSIVAGSTWRAESEAVKQSFRELAARERANHAVAFPRYRFAPRRITSPPLPSQNTHAYASELLVSTSDQQLAYHAVADIDIDTGMDIGCQDVVLYQDLTQWLSDNRVPDGL